MQQCQWYHTFYIEEFGTRVGFLSGGAQEEKK